MTYTLDNFPEQLTIGQPVFLLGYCDRDFKLPFVRPYIFIGVTESEEGRRKIWNFRSVKGAADIKEYPQVTESTSGVLSVDHNGLATFVDWNGLVKELSEKLEELKK